MLYALDQKTQVALLKQLTAKEKGEMYAIETVKALNYNVSNNTRTS